MSTKREVNKKKKDLGGDALRQALLKDDAFKRYRVILKNMKERYDLDAILEEAQLLHDGRLSRLLKGTNPGPQKIAEAALQDGSNRSRMTSLYAKLIRQHDILDIAVKAAKTHIFANYGDNIPKLGTKAERLSYLDTYVGSGVRFLSELDTVLKCLEAYTKDIDQVHFQLKLAFNTLSLVYDKNKEM